METYFSKSKVFFLVLFLHIIATRGDVSDEFEIESEFDDEPTLGRNLAAQLNEIAEWSLPQTKKKKGYKDLHMPRKIHTNQMLKQDDKIVPRTFADFHQNARLWANTHYVEPATVCSDFPQTSNTVSCTTCSSVVTLHGVVNWCEITCRSGYKLKAPLLRYEICGKATKYRWTFQLMGLNQTLSRCVVGNSSVTMEPCRTPECFETAAYYLNKIDFSVDPCDSFFDFACGRWVKETPVPSFRSFYDEYSSIRDRVAFQIADLLAQPVSPSDSDSAVKAKIIYQSCMDLDQIEALGPQPLLDLLHDGISWPIIDPLWTESNFDFEKTMATLRGKFNSKVMIDFSVRKHNGFYVLECLKGKDNLGYHKQDKKKHHDSLAKDIALMLGADPLTVDADIESMKIFERELTAIKACRLDDQKRCQKQDKFQELTIKEMKQSIPEINWLVMLKDMIQTAPVTDNTVVLVWNEKYLNELIKLVNKFSKRAVQNFMVWSIVKNRIKSLSDKFLKRLLKHPRETKGIKTLRERRHKCAHELMLSLQETTSKLYLDYHFAQATKKSAVELFKYIRKGFIHLLKTEVKWMDANTKSYAIKKAMAIKSEVGYNSKIFDNPTYLNQETSQLEVKRNDYFGNFVGLLEVSTQKAFVKLGQATHRGAIPFIRPTMVNAFYGASQNEIILPAGELQSPLFWRHPYPTLLRFGAIGSILGHELTHGFDNYGRKFDADGELGNWWSNSSLNEFKKRVRCIEDQYNNYFWKAANKFVDGVKAVSENIADNGGVRESHAAYRLWRKSKQITEEQMKPITGFTNDQMFFISYASVRCSKYTQQAARRTIAISTHSPGRYRVDGPLQNFKKFSEAFNCPVGSVMNPKKKCIIW